METPEQHSQQTENRWQPLADFAHQNNRDSGLRAWLAVLEGSVRALEKAAWQGRDMAERALSAWRAMERGAGAVSEECRQLAVETRRWPGRLKRLSKTAWVLTRIMSSYRLWGTRAAFLPQSKQGRALEQLHQRNARRFRDLSLQQGGAFLKIGQLLSCRADLLPDAWVQALAQLQDQARAEPWDALIEVIEADFGEPLEALFEWVDPQPLAAASIGQVHRARLSNQREVVIKIQRPNLAELVEQDLLLLKVFVESLRSSLPAIDLDTIINEIQSTVRRELDYLAEARDMIAVSRQLHAMEGVRVPHCHLGLCSKRVLTCDWVDGDKLSVVLDHYQQQDPERRDLLMQRLLDAWLSQLFHGGLLHADPHPGNLLVDREGQLVLLDFGATLALSDQQRQQYFRVLQACVVAEYADAADTLKELGFVTASGEGTTLEAFAASLMEQVRTGMLAPEGSSGWPSPADNAEQINALMTQLDQDPLVTLPREFVMLARIFAALGGLFMYYQPKMNLAELMMRYLTRPLNASQAEP